MADAGFQLANLIAELLGGRNPEWVQQESYADAPAAADDGISLRDAIITLVVIGLRENVHQRRAEITVTTFDAAATYTVNVNGTAMTDVTPTTADDLLVGLKNTINANAVVGGAAATPIVTAQCLDSTGAVTLGTAAAGNAAVTLELLGGVEAGFDLIVSATGTGVLAAVADAESATVRFWLYSNTNTTRSSAATAPERWALVPNSEKVLDFRGLSGDARTNGCARLYVEVEDIDGPAGDGVSITYRLGGGVHVGPCIRESA